MFTTLAEELPALSSGLEWAIDYGANNVVLSVVATGLPGDYNANGVVELRIPRAVLGDPTRLHQLLEHEAEIVRGLPLRAALH